jgi:hypothetical protein
MIQQSAAQKVWCVGFDWLEDSFEEGRLLIPSTYAYEGGFLKGRISDEALVEIFEEAHAVGMTATDVSKKMLAEVSHTSTVLALLMGQHGIYSAKSWKNMYSSWLNRSGRFANIPRQASIDESIPTNDRSRQVRHPSTQDEVIAPTDSSPSTRASAARESGPSNHQLALQSTASSGESRNNGPKLTEERMRILRDAYPMCLVGGQYVEVARHLARQVRLSVHHQLITQYPEHTEGSWGRMFYSWRRLTDHQDYANYRSVFRSYLPSVAQDTSVEEISKLLAIDVSSALIIADGSIQTSGIPLRNGMCSLVTGCGRAKESTSQLQQHPVVQPL